MAKIRLILTEIRSERSFKEVASLSVSFVRSQMIHVSFYQAFNLTYTGSYVGF